jgi:hypothetical protein
VNPVKHKAMKKCQTSVTGSSFSEGFVNAPSYPKTASQVLRELKRSLDEAGRPSDRTFDQKEFARLLGAPKSTIHDWYYGELPRPIRYFLCGIERLSASQRLQLLRNLCRDNVTFDDLLMWQDPEAISGVKALLHQPHGLTVLTAETERLSTLVLGAMGNTAVRHLHLRAIAGFDVHYPDRFAPIPGVRYWLSRRRNPEAHLLLREWTMVEDSPARLIFLNGVLSILPSLTEKIIALARRRHVVVADQSIPQTLQKMERTLIVVSAPSKRVIRVHLESSCARPAT